MMLPGLAPSCPQIKNKMTFPMCTELEQQEKFSPLMGVLCVHPRELPLLISANTGLMQLGPRRTGSHGSLGTGPEVHHGRVWLRDTATTALIPQLHRGGSLGWEVRLKQFAIVNRSEIASVCICLSLPHTRESSSWLGSQVPRRKVSGRSQGSDSKSPCFSQKPIRVLKPAPSFSH